MLFVTSDVGMEMIIHLSQQKYVYTQKKYKLHQLKGIPLTLLDRREFSMGLKGAIAPPPPTFF